MKKSTQFFKGIIAICVVIMFVACKKDTNYDGSKVLPPVQPINQARGVTSSTPYTGTSTLGDSTANRKKPTVNFDNDTVDSTVPPADTTSKVK